MRKKTLRPMKKKPDWVNDEKAGGASLAQGSSEYREMIRDHYGMDEHEQDDYVKNLERRSADVMEPSVKEAGKKDDWHRAEQAENAEYAGEISGQFAREKEGVLSTAERKVSHQIRKESMTKDALAAAAAQAEQTESEADDDFVEHQMPEELHVAVYDDGVTEEMYFPGSKTLNKYM